MPQDTFQSIIIMLVTYNLFINSFLNHTFHIHIWFYSWWWSTVHPIHLMQIICLFVLWNKSVMWILNHFTDKHRYVQRGSSKPSLSLTFRQEDGKPNVQTLFFTATHMSGGLQVVNSWTFMWCFGCLPSPRYHRLHRSVLQMPFVLSRVVSCSVSNIQVLKPLQPRCCQHKLSTRLLGQFESLLWNSQG